MSVSYSQMIQQKKKGREEGRKERRKRSELTKY